MRETLRKLAFALPAVALLGGVAFANGSNLYDHDGKDRNGTSFNFESDTEIDVDNDADIFNEIFARVNTGDNEVEDNEDDVDLETGDASAEVAIENDVNHTMIEVGGGCCPDLSEIDWEEMRGDDCDNNHNNGGCKDHGRNCNGNHNGNNHNGNNGTSFNWENDTEIDVDNDANVRNEVNLNVNTGDNEVEDNEGDVSVSTGNASAEVSVTNVVNHTGVTVK